jgi:maltodextrin utilization protein YvdJ
MQPYPNITSSSVQEAVNPLNTPVVDQLEKQLSELRELQQGIILDLIVMHREARDEIIIEITKQKFNFIEDIGEEELSLKNLEMEQREELKEMLDVQNLQMQTNIQTITLHRLKGVIDNLGPF